MFCLQDFSQIIRLLLATVSMNGLIGSYQGSTISNIFTCPVGLAKLGSASPGGLELNCVLASPKNKENKVKFTFLLGVL